MVSGKGGGVVSMEFPGSSIEPIDIKFCDLLNSGTMQVWMVPVLISTVSYQELAMKIMQHCFQGFD